MMDRLRLKVVIPVYQGASNIEKTLAALLGEVWSEIAVIVIVNGPADAAQTLAEPLLNAMAAKGAWTSLLTLPKACRSAALDAGDRAGPAKGHRLYLDQDAIVSPGSLIKLIANLDNGAHFVAAIAQWHGLSSIAVRAQQCWSALDYVRASPATAGLYAVSEEGRRRWGGWPAMIADDKFARMHFQQEERVLNEQVYYEVNAPPGLPELISARRRYRNYNRSLKLLYPELIGHDRGRGLVRNLIRLKPRHWLGGAVLGFAEIAARLPTILPHGESKP